MQEVIIKGYKQERTKNETKRRRKTTFRQGKKAKNCQK